MTNGFLTTHILDTAHGIPAQDVMITLYRIENNERILIRSAVTNDDGRTDSPLLPKGEMHVGQYELVFAIGKYFKDKGVSLAEPLFLDEVPLRFGINDPESHYHVPLLASPFSYSTYRGS